MFPGFCSGIRGLSTVLKAQLPRYHNLFLLKAFTKRYAMAGVRLGYGITENEELLEKDEHWPHSHGIYLSLHRQQELRHLKRQIMLKEHEI